jgi:hypothetical protein
LLFCQGWMSVEIVSKNLNCSFGFFREGTDNTNGFGQFEKAFDILVTQAGYYGIHKKIAEKRAEHYLGSCIMARAIMRRRFIPPDSIRACILRFSQRPSFELRRSMWDFLTEMNESGTSIILTTHYLEEAEMWSGAMGSAKSKIKDSSLS